jgi:hypothetical protein
MPSETRYLRSDTHTVNGLTARKLGTDLTGSVGTGIYRTAVAYSSADFGVRFFRRLADGTEVEIISTGTPIIVGTRTTLGAGLQSTSISVPEIALNPTDAIIVRCYYRNPATTGTWTQTEWDTPNWITPQLNALKLNAATWTVYLYTEIAPSETLGKYDVDLHFGSTTVNSRIENFTWTPYVPVSRVSISDFEKGFGEGNVYSGKAYSQYDNTIVPADPTKAFEVSLLDAWNNGTSDTTIGFRFGAGAIRFQKKLPPRSGFIINLVKAKWRGPVNTPFNIYSYDPSPKISFTVTGELV